MQVVKLQAAIRYAEEDLPNAKVNLCPISLTVVGLLTEYIPCRPWLSSVPVMTQTQTSIWAVCCSRYVLSGSLVDLMYKVSTPHPHIIVLFVELSAVKIWWQSYVVPQKWCMCSMVDMFWCLLGILSIPRYQYPCVTVQQLYGPLLDSSLNWGSEVRKWSKV